MADDKDLIDVEYLVTLFEDSEDATLDARKLAERDADYYHNKQLTSAEKAALKKRGQPEIVINRIKRKIDFLVGVEKSQRVDPQALPNTPKHEDDAAGATMALRYVADSEDYDKLRSAAWRNMLVEGCGGISVRIEERRGELYVSLNRIPWDRMFYDPHSSESDFGDAAYKGIVTWMDYDDAAAKYHDKDQLDILDATLSSPNPHDTFDDKPKIKVWADSKRKRVRIVQIWLKRDEQWYWAEFTRGGILKGGPSPYVTDKGESDCELIFQSAYVDRDNNRYGVVREMISPQDEVNKRRSKALHLLNVSQIFYRNGAVDNIEDTRREVARPDGTVMINGSANNPLDHDFKVITGIDLAAAQLGLLQEAKNEIDLMGPNGTMLGDKTQGSAAASGKAIIASQQGGMMEMGDLIDNLRHLDIRVFRAIWYRVRQYWTEEKWVRVTDDERNIKWVGMNVDPAQVQQLGQMNPQAMKQIAGVVASVAELDCDITIDDAPDSLTPQLEQFEALVNLKKYDADNELPFRALIAAAPNLRQKDKIFEEMDRQQEQKQKQAQMREQLEMQNAQAEIADTVAAGKLKGAQAFKTALEAKRGPEGRPPDQPEDPRMVQAELLTMATEAKETEANTRLKHTQAMKTALETKLMPAQIMQQARDSRRSANINEMKARQAPRAAA